MAPALLSRFSADWPLQFALWMTSIGWGAFNPRTVDRADSSVVADTSRMLSPKRPCPRAECCATSLATATATERYVSSAGRRTTKLARASLDCNVLQQVCTALIRLEFWATNSRSVRPGESGSERGKELPFVSAGRRTCVLDARWHKALTRWR
jgi:hypothetical protein